VKTKLLTTLSFLTLLTTASIAWDREIPTKCKESFQIAMDAKGTSEQSETFREFLECTGEFTPKDIEIMLREKLCYNFQYTWVGEGDFSCTPLHRIKG